MNATAPQCQYQFRDGGRCHRPAESGDLCFWHSPHAEKKGVEIKARLEEMVRSGASLEGFCLAHADLEDVHLVRLGTKAQTNLKDADLYRANLRHGHLFNVNLSGASLMKAKLDRANLNLADLTDANLLGTRFNQTKLENVTWGEALRQERAAASEKAGGNAAEAQLLFKEAEEIYRHLQTACETMGLYDNAGIFLQRRMIMRRYQLPLWSGRRFVSKVVDMACGYGENPVKVIFFSLFIIFSFALIYFFFGIQGPSHTIRYTAQLALFSNIYFMLEALYFSVVTFTTLGYGDISPIGVTRFFATFEAFIGSFSLALFVVVFVKKMTR